MLHVHGETLPHADPWLIAQLSLLFLSYVFLSLDVCHLIMSLQQCCPGNFWVLIAGQIYFWLPGDVVSPDWSIVVSKVSWHCIVLLGQLAWSTHFASHRPTCWMLSGFFFAFILVELRNKWILAFLIIICLSST